MRLYSIVVYVSTKLIRGTVWCYWFPANQRTDKWPNRKRVYSCVSFKRAKRYTTVHRINTVVSKVTKFSQINIVTDLIRREMLKPSRLHREWDDYNTAMHGGWLYILLYSLEYSGIYFTKISNNQIHLSRAMRKCVLCYMRTTKAQISLRIRAVWSASLLFAA